MSPFYHLIVSGLITILFIIKNISIINVIYLSSLGIVFGVLIDIDHLIWALVFNPLSIKKHIQSLDFRGLWMYLNNNFSLYHLPYSKLNTTLFYLFLHSSFIITVHYIASHVFQTEIILITYCLIGHLLLDIINMVKKQDYK